jgi:NAD(P)H-flavin reductase
VRGPYGVGYLREGTDPVLLVAGGSGIAPILSILQQAAEHGDPPMCDTASLLLEAKGVRDGRIFLDRFHAAV